MAEVYVAKLSFTQDNGEITPYKRLCISGVIGGTVQTLQLKLNQTELLLAEMLLDSEEEPLEVKTRRATKDESDEFFKKNGRASDDDTINLEIED